MNDSEERIDIYLDHEPGVKVRCLEGRRFYGMDDHAPERVYRHLNVCQMETHIHVRLPRVKRLVIMIIKRCGYSVVKERLSTMS